MQFLPSKFNTNPYKNNLSKKALFVLAPLLFLNALSPKTAHAGLFSFIEGIVSDEASAKTTDVPYNLNSQNMSVLEAPVNIDPNSNVSYADEAPIISGSALVAEIGPAGTASEVQNEFSTEISLYTVRDGDSLGKIAQMFGVSVNTIVWANELGKDKTIRPGQTLVILPISGIRYTVKKGDTIKGIVLRYKGDLEEVLQYNDLTLSSVIAPGDTIVIPDAEPTVPVIAKTGTKVVGANPVHHANGPYYPGYYMRPIDGGRKSQDLHGYNGVDLAAPVGTPIHAAAAGTVIASMTNGGWNGGYGNYVIISHSNGTQTLYSHNQKNFVKVGDRVEKGQLIAKIGMTGKTSGPHVHFEIRGAKNPF